MQEKLSVRDLDLKGKRVLVRVDYNVPMDKGMIVDDTRIKESLPTIKYILDQGGTVLLMSHLGRPKGQIDPKLSLEPCAKHLSTLLNLPVRLAPDCCGFAVEQMVKELKAKEIIILENLRFHPGEEHPDEEATFVSSLAELGDVYVNDAFGCAHRAHASTTLIAKFFPGKAAMGFLLEKEVAYLGKTLLNPQRPFCAILGGSKISTKFKVIESLLKKADILLIGGAMAYTFFKSEGIPIGNSLFEEDYLHVAREIIDVSSQSNCKVLLPIDIVIADKIDAQANVKVVSVKEGIPENYQGVDIGPQTIQKYKKELQRAGTVFWNGPLGVYECAPFAIGTQEIAKVVADLSAVTIIGGGDLIAAVDRAGVSNKMSHISTGGGACLEYIELGELPGIESLSDKEVISNN